MKEQKADLKPREQDKVNVKRVLGGKYFEPIKDFNYLIMRTLK